MIIMNNGKIKNFSYIILCFSYMLMSVIKLSPSIVMPAYQTRFNLSASAVGLISSMFYLSYAVMQLCTGPICKKFGSFKVLSAGITVSVIGMLLFAFAFNPLCLFIGRFLQGLGLGPIFISLVFFMQGNYEGHTYVRLMGIAVMACSIGSALSGAPLNALVETVGISNVFLIISAFSCVLLLCSVVICFKYKDNRTEAEKSEHIHLGQQLKDCLKVIAGSTPIKCCIVLWTSYNAVQIVYQGLWSAQWFRTVYPLYNSFAGLSSTIASSGLIISCAISDFIVDKKHSANHVLYRICRIELFFIAMLVVGKNLSVTGGTVFAVVTSLFLDFVYGFFTGHLSIQVSASIKENSGSEKTATITGIGNFISAIVSQILQWLTGRSIDIFAPVRGMSQAFSITFVFVTLAFGCSVLYCRRLKKLN